jgi:hypothetical protein
MPEVDLWTLKGSLRGSLNGAQALEELVHLLDSARDRLHQLMARYPDAVFDLVLVVYIPEPDYLTPDITLSHELLDRIAALRIQFSVSLYVIEGD